MEIYKNLNGDSGVEAYEIRENAIVVQFKNSHPTGYRFYTYGLYKPGATRLQKMKELAVVGRGLNSYIAAQVKDDYEKRTRLYE